MERRVFKFGSNSVALIVPKKWLDKSGLKPSSSVFISETESGNLVVSPTETARQEAERVITSKTKPSFLSRWIGLHYMYGVGRLRVYSADGLTQAQIEGVENKINRECPGFEITSQSGKDIVIEDLTNVKEIDLDKIIGRLRSLINQEFEEMLGGDRRSVGRIEKLVNRFYMLGTRYVNITQAKDALTYFGILEFLEHISDKMEMLAVEFRSDDKEALTELRGQFDLSFSALKGNDKDIEKVAEMRERILRRLSHSRTDKRYARLIREISDDISGVSEFGLRAEGAHGVV